AQSVFSVHWDLRRLVLIIRIVRLRILVRTPDFDTVGNCRRRIRINIRTHLYLDRTAYSKYTVRSYRRRIIAAENSGRTRKDIVTCNGHTLARKLPQFDGLAGFYGRWAVVGDR